MKQTEIVALEILIEDTGHDDEKEFDKQLTRTHNVDDCVAASDVPAWLIPALE